MTRRSWFSRIFGGGEQSYFLGIQVLIRAFGEDTLRAKFARVISDPDGTLEDVEAKRRYIKRIIALLMEQEPYWSQLFWDYKTDHAESETEFNTWATELSASAATEHEELDHDVDGMRRLSKSKDYVAVTLIFHLTEPYPPADVSEEALYWRRETLRSLLDGLLYLDPETILADGVFVVPGSAEDGLSEEDLLTGGWSYLRVIT